MTRKMYKKLPFDYSKIVKNVGKNNSSNNNNTKLSNNSLNLSQLKQRFNNIENKNWNIMKTQVQLQQQVQQV